MKYDLFNNDKILRHIMYETSFNKDCKAAVTESNAYDGDAAVILG